MYEAEHIALIKDNVLRPTKQTVANVAMASAGQEYSYTFPAGTVHATLKLRSQNAKLQYCFVSGETDTTYITLEQNATLPIKDVSVGGKTIYFESPTASQTLEVLSFQT